MSATTRASFEQVAPGWRYDPVAQAFHWLTVALLVAQYATELVLPYLLPKSAEDSLAAWHVSLGPTILLVIVLRVMWRLLHRPPPPPADLPPALRLLSRVTHWLLYAVLIVLPVLGWIAASAFGVTPYLLGFVPLPALAAPSKRLAEMVGDIHGALALALLALIVLHITGALYHALIKRDGVMQRMLSQR